MLNSRLKLTQSDIIFFILLSSDLILKVLLTINHNHWRLGDLLAPLFLADQFFHQEIPNLSSQQFLVPMFVGNLMRMLGTPNDFITMLHISGSVTAVSSSLTLIPLYIIARKFLTPIQSTATVWLTLLLITNAWFSLHSYFFNLINVYTLFFTTSIAMMLFCKDKPTVYLVLLSTIVGLSYYVRHEGIVLSLIFVLFLFWSWKRKDIQKKQMMYSILVVLSLVILNWIIRIQNPMTNALGFFYSSSAVGGDISSFGNFALLNYSFIQLFNLFYTTFGFMLQGYGASLLAILTIVGVFFLPIGYHYLTSQRIHLSWVLIYWLVYTLLILVMALIQPRAALIGNLSLLQAPTMANFDAGSYKGGYIRYFQPLIPFFLLFVYAGVLFSIKRLSEWKKFLVHVCIVFLMLYQIIQIGYYYLNNYNRFGKSSIEIAATDYSSTINYITTAQFFRNKNIRQANILYYNSDTANKIFFSFMSGGNTINCWNGSRFGRPRNEYNCFHKYPENTFDSLLKAKREKFDYIITHTHAPPKYLLRHYSPAFASGHFRIYKHK